MPWCDDCEKYWAPSAMTPEGQCPTCGNDLEAPETPNGEVDEKAPWHFKLLVVALVVYLGYRFFEMFIA
ncbi:MAG: hypothetical protein ABW328_02235 [Ilumatobacteraceae bacterium]